MAKPSIIRVGYETTSKLRPAERLIPRNHYRIFTKPTDSVPGPRTRALVANTQFPWLESLALSREGLICGPSSGFNLQGLHQFLRKHQEQGNLQHLAKEDGQVHCAFICCDLTYQYLDDYFSKLGQDHFSPIINDVGWMFYGARPL